MIDLGAPSGPRVYTVAAISAELKRLLVTQFPDVRVSGEISNCSHARSGHWYFTLKDEQAEISCVCFRQDARYLKTVPRDGNAVVAGGRISVFEKKGKYQLYVDSLQPLGTGALQQEFDRLKARLAAEGLFDEQRKRPLPQFPKCIGIVTSPTGAVIADILRVLERRHPGLHIRLYPTAVQGAGAAEQIAEGIRFFSEQPWADVVIVGRGGGPLEDLWAFNEEVVARAIAASRVPVVAAVGHQTDFTIADFVADLRAPTPSAAAELVVPEAAALIEGLFEIQDRLARAMQARLSRLKARVLESSLHRAARSVEHRVGVAGQRLDDAFDRLRNAQEGRLDRANSRLEKVQRGLARLDLRVHVVRQSKHLGEISQRLWPALRRSLDRWTYRLDSVHARLVALSPVAILERGYAIVQNEAGAAVREAGQVAIGDPLAVRLARGETRRESRDGNRRGRGFSQAARSRHR